MFSQTFFETPYHKRLANPYLESLILRFYEQIISGFWAVMMLMPVEQIIYKAIREPYAANCFTVKYVIFCTICTTLVVISSIALPNIRATQLRRKLCTLLITNHISNKQKERMQNIFQESLMCKGFFTKEGFGQFVMVNLFNFAIIAAYYGFENLASIWMGGSSASSLPSLIFTTIFVICMTMSWRLDLYLSKYITSRKQYAISPLIKETNKIILMTVLKFLTRDSFENNVNQAILEDTVNEVCQILEITLPSNRMKTSKLNRKQVKE